MAASVTTASAGCRNVGCMTVTGRDAAALVARRLILGASGQDVAQAMDEGVDAFLQRTLPVTSAGAPHDVRVPPPPVPDGSTRGIYVADPELLTIRDRWSEDKIRQTRKQRLDHRRPLSAWWFRRMVESNTPVRERIAWLWHGHFTSSLIGVLHGPAMLAQQQAFYDLGLGHFDVLADRMLHDRAMMEWLDGHQNVVGAPNENLAREFMELFTLGIGHYTEKDVQEGARALTGWKFIDGDAPMLAPKYHDDGEKTILGRTGRWGSSDFARIVLEKPQVDRHIAASVYRHLVSDNAPSRATVDRLVAALGPERNLRNVIIAAVVPHADSQGASRVMGPVEWMVGVARCFNVDLTDAEAMDKATAGLGMLGQQPFRPPTVAGWPGGRRWLTMNAIGGRFDWSFRVLKRADLSFVDNEPQHQRLDMLARRLGVQKWSESTTQALQPLVDHPHELCVAALTTPEYMTV